MGEIEISSVKNESLKQLLNSIDQDPQGDKNGKINSAFEESALRGTANNLEEFGKELDEEGKLELKEIMGLQTSQSAVVTSNAIAQQGATSVTGVAAISSKEAQNSVKKNLEYWVKNGARPNEVMQVLRERIQDSSYRAALNDVENVLKLVIATQYNSCLLWTSKIQIFSYPELQ